MKFRSGFELIYAQHLAKNGIPFEHEPKWFTLGPNSRYLPDFYLPESDEYVEVKGEYTANAKVKHDAFRALGLKLAVVLQQDIKELIPYSLHTFYRRIEPKPKEAQQTA